MDYSILKEFTKKLDRAAFIDNEYKNYAYMDRALPIGYEQTISQPSLVLEMTYQLALTKDCTVLEIGTGSGYQTAILAAFSKTVYTVERIKELSEKAKARLTNMGYRNIRHKIADGSDGWREFAPFDRIIVTAAAREIPEELIEQLRSGGRMVIPIGPPDLQELQLLTKDEKGKVSIKVINHVRFVEMKGKYGWKKKE